MMAEVLVSAAPKQPRAKTVLARNLANFRDMKNTRSNVQKKGALAHAGMNSYGDGAGPNWKSKSPGRALTRT